jgi:predicted SAM-dependent methyltransferase
MLASRLCDGAAYTRAIESALSALIAAKSQTSNSNHKDLNMKTFLHIGCGPKRKDRTTRGFNTDTWTELRFDIDESVKPDLVGTMTDMSAVADASVDAIFSSHNIEHLYPHEVPLALKEFMRVLKPDGFLVVTCPDLQSVCQLVAEDKLTDAAYTSPAGPIAPLDILYGHRPAMARGNLYMAHRCGFTQKVLGGTLHSAGFAKVAINRRAHPSYDLWAIATKAAMDDAELRALAAEHFPR